ncbi:MAG: exo-alpha-sialidase [Nitrospirae bacterium]|nr:exo-alpha-sialidase [Nitrospirota bacterium]
MKWNPLLHKSWFLIPLAVLMATACGSKSTPPSPETKPVDPPATTLFAEPVNLSNTSGDSEGPLLAFDGSGRVTLLWKETVPESGEVEAHTETYRIASTDNGSSFSGGSTLWSGHTASGFGMAMGKGREFYAWLSPVSGTSGVSEAFFHGTPLNSPTLLSSGQSLLPVGNPAITRDEGGRIYTAWSEGGAGTRNLYLKATKDEGKTFSKAVKVSNPTVDLEAEGPLLMTEGSGLVDLVWVGTPANGERKIRHSRTVNQGISFSTPVSLSPDGVDAYCPQGGLAGDGWLFVAWVGTSAGNTDLYLTISTDRTVFSGPASVGRSAASCPRMAVGKVGGAFFVWEEGGRSGLHDPGTKPSLQPP